MAPTAQGFPVSGNQSNWFFEWLKDELAPYPGRMQLVFRMVIASTLVMVVCMAYRIPYAWQAAVYALLVSRENPRSTINSSATILFVTALSTIYILISIHLVINTPAIHFIWIIGTCFLTFFAISAQTSYLAAVALVNTISIAVPLWDHPLRPEIAVEDVIRLCLAVFFAVVITTFVELLYVRWRPGNDILSSIDERLSAARDLLICYAEGCPAEPGIERKALRLQALGLSTLRQTLVRSNYSAEYFSTMATVSSLVGRIVDLVAALTQVKVEWSAQQRARLHSLGLSIASIRTEILAHRIPARLHFDSEEDPARAGPLLGELEHVVSLIALACIPPQPGKQDAPSPDHLASSALLASDAFTNRDHVRFALKGCLPASICYVIYSGIAWPGISTAVTTCLLTALSTIGASRQKQILRIAGAVLGGFGFGLGAQMLILPHVDSIAGFTVVFVAVTAFCCWFLTSSARLSYFGVQAAVAFYLIHLQEFRFQNSLAVGRDRVVGVLLGLFVMWLVFDRLWGKSAAVEMQAALISTVRSLAQLAKLPASRDIEEQIARSVALRETINAGLDKVSAQSDGVLFEFGPSRERDLQLRAHVRRWQPRLRALLLMRIALQKYRLQLPGFELPEPLRVRLEMYDDDSARLLEEIADRIEGKALNGNGDAAPGLPNSAVERIAADAAAYLRPGQTQSLTTLLGGIHNVTTVLASEMLSHAFIGLPGQPLNAVPLR